MSQYTDTQHKVVANPTKWIDYSAEQAAYLVGFSYDPRMVANIKEAINPMWRSFNGSNKQWVVKPTASNQLYTFARINGFAISEDAWAAMRRFSEVSTAAEKDTQAQDIHTSRVIDLTQDGKHYTVALYRDDKNMQAVLRSVPGRMWDYATHLWRVPLSSGTDLALFALRYEIDVTPRAKEALGPAMNIELTASNELKMELFPFQKAGVQFMSARKFVLNGDEMGCGKTAQSIATMCEIKQWPVLVLCPKSLMANWRSEWRAWTNKTVHIVGTDGYGDSVYKMQRKSLYGQQLRAHLVADVYICNYEGINKLAGLEGFFKAVIIDEAHNLKNKNTARYKKIAPFCINQEVQSVITLTGTPVLNNVRELMTILKLIRAMSHFGGDAKFERDYIASSRRPDYTTRLKYLNDIMAKHFFIRREKKDVMKEMPDKIRQKVYVPLRNSTVYIDAYADIAKYLRDYRKMSVEQANKSAAAEGLAKVHYLKQIAAAGKIEAGCELVESLVEQGQKVVCFAYHKEIVQAIAERCNKFTSALVIDGDTPVEMRQKNVDTFTKNDKHKVIVLSLKAGNTGLNLQVASRVVFFEMGWTPGEMEQAEDRCYRIGTKDTVYCHYLIAEPPTPAVGSIDERIYEIIDRKREIAKAVTNTQMVVQEVKVKHEAIINEILNSL
jgi:SWI/SNF-related matrix-associated actin-dependent regulator 1 of chromatin subfamily A